LEISATIAGNLDGNQMTVLSDGSIGNLQLNSGSYGYSIAFCLSDLPTSQPTSVPSSASTSPQTTLIYTQSQPTFKPTDDRTAAPTEEEASVVDYLTSKGATTIAIWVAIGLFVTVFLAMVMCKCCCKRAPEQLVTRYDTVPLEAPSMSTTI
jgi:hypothetical protein